MYQEALKTCQDGLQKHPNYWSARVSMGRIHYELGDPEKAREELEKVIKAVPDNLLANKLLGDIYRESGKYEDALKRYHLVEMLTPADAEVAASIRKIEAELQSAPTPSASKGPTEPLQVHRVTPQIEEPSKKSEEEFQSSAPTRILSREDLRAAMPPEPRAEFIPVGAEPTIDLDDTQSSEAVREEVEVVELTEDSERTTEVDELNTQTLAEIYMQQGLPEKAIKVYQKLLLKDPGNEEVALKLRNLNPADVLLAAAAREEPNRNPEPKVREPESLKRRPVEFLTDERKRKISTLENWLATIRRERTN